MFREVMGIPSYYDSLCQIESASIVRENRNTEEFSMGHEVILTKDESGWIVAGCTELPGCVSQGNDEAEALVNIREARSGWLWAEEQKAAETQL
jgi:predicted RNase H-like HicB family nuclease